MNPYLIECCANSVQSAIYGEQAGADRIELCRKLELGGITPFKKDIINARKKIIIPLHILIRPRPGDFIYSKKEILEMISDIQFCKKIGCEGIVIGLLTTQGSIDIEQTKKLVAVAKPMHVTFHRAFDKGNNLQQNLEDIITCECNTILTAGQKENVVQGKTNLKKLITLAANRIIILAGSGVHHNNTKDLYKIGIRDFHLSGSKKTKNEKLETDPLLIKSVIDKIKQLV